MLSKKYDPKKSEAKWQQFWLDKKIYGYDTKSKAETYSVDTPPPTLSGKMHIGHAFSYIQQDFAVRFHRMLGKNIFYPFGTDDNGLPTERMVERLEGVKSSDMKRSKFIELCKKNVAKKRPEFVQDWKDIGISADFSLFYSTIDDHSRKISQKSFIDLYNQERAYRKRTPFMWCPECQTAIAQVEMEDKETKSQFVYFKMETSLDKPIVIATTRPELLPACVAVHVHPEDKRYKEFIGEKAKLPFFDREVKIYANKDVDMEFGSGAVYHCTFGDMDDAEWIEELGIEPIEIMNKDGTLNRGAGKYQGLSSKEARKAIIKDLEKAGLITRKEKIKHVVNVHERCGTEIEILMTDQWFIKYLDLKQKFLDAGQELSWYPEHMKNRYDNWVKGLKWDWCISRQRHYGIPFPVWYCKSCGEVVLANEKQLPVDPLADKPTKKCQCGSSKFTPEKDVMDTWATSSLTPQIAVGLVDEKLRKKLFPMNLRPQAHDIISFWLFNTVVKSQLHEDKNPWKDVMISGWVLDPNGKKMSKSKGNVIEPQEVLDKYSVDAMRYWAASSSVGEDIPYKEKELVTGQRFIKKLWNATRFITMNVEQKLDNKPAIFEDKWILAEADKTVKEVTRLFTNYKTSRAMAVAEDFFKNVFCDYYLEMVKDRLYNSKRKPESAQSTLYTVLLKCLKMFAPIVSHVAEEIYQQYFKEFEQEKSIHICKWPEYSEPEQELLETGQSALKVIDAIRKFKTDNNMAMNEPISSVTVNNKNIEPMIPAIKQTMKIKKLDIGNASQITAEETKLDIEK